MKSGAFFNLEAETSDSLVVPRSFGGTNFAKGGDVKRRVLAVSLDGQLELELLDSDTVLEGVFRARDLSTGEVLQLAGWLWEFQDLDEAFDGI
ncbi:hypothetical protein [Microvirga alba]|uniref:Uncharacterized protein n=1 Tax=Microvirga alba TaxID=2791025 RepID=A0A931BTD8_9HYPH|nr:hypothetical protein [Microvirga alba]MBF9235633.1 hypothetical protein [Microvirga alba]